MSGMKYHTAANRFSPDWFRHFVDTDPAGTASRAVNHLTLSVFPAARRRGGPRSLPQDKTVLKPSTQPA
jgi:hypothetical protein